MKLPILFASVALSFSVSIGGMAPAYSSSSAAEGAKAPLDLTAALMRSSQLGNEGDITYLIKNKADLNAKGRLGLAAIHIAARAGHVGVLGLLLDGGASIEGVTSRGETALYWAVKGEHPEVVRFLLDRGAKADARDAKGMTPLHEAISRSIVDAVVALRKAGADPLAGVPGQGEKDFSPLALAKMLAKEKGTPEAQKILEHLQQKNLN